MRGSSRRLDELTHASGQRDGRRDPHATANSGNGTATPLTDPASFSRADVMQVRDFVARLHLRGSGLEIGALHQPLALPPGAQVKYVDRLQVAELRRQYPELDPLPLVQVDIIDDGERLGSVPDASQDFVIANHFLEHCGDPIGSFGTLLRVLKPGGLIYMAIPDKRFTFDQERPLTTLEHLTRDHTDGPDGSKRGHFEEYAQFVHKMSSAEEVTRETDRLIELDYSIHYHVWRQTEMFELISVLQTRYGYDFDVEMFVKNDIEAIFVFKRLS